MAAGIIAAVFGAAEAVLLKKTLGFFTSGEYTAAVAFALIKLLLYGAALPVLVFLFPAHIIECVIGYAAGLPLSVMFFFILNTINAGKASSGDGKNESGNNN